MALLKLERSGLPSILLSSTDDIEGGEELLSIGYPADTDGEESFGLTNRNGQINAERSKGPSNLPFYETSARLTPGMSGGPPSTSKVRSSGWPASRTRTPTTSSRPRSSRSC